MARARNIKPAFFKNESLVELPFETRLLFVGLWTLADREGRLEDRPKRIKMEVFPADNVDVDQSLALLAASGFIERYTVNGLSVIEILNFSKHQNPHHTEKHSELPDRNGEFTVKDRESDGGNLADSLIPDSLKPDSGKKAPPPPCPTQEIIELFNTEAPDLVQARIVTDTVKTSISARWRQSAKHQSQDFWKRFFSHCNSNDFLAGRGSGRSGSKPFRAGLEWIVKAENFAKIINGNYDNE
jgi:hypothetical protein